MSCLSYKTKPPLPSDNHYVSVEGRITDVQLNSNSGQASSFYVTVENIGFLGHAVPANARPPTESASLLQYTLYSHPFFLQHPLQLLPLALTSTSIQMTLNLPNLSLKHHLLRQKVQNDNRRERAEVDCCIPCFHILYMLHILFFISVCTKCIAAQTRPFAFNTVSCF